MNVPKNFFLALSEMVFTLSAYMALTNIMEMEDEWNDGSVDFTSTGTGNMEHNTQDRILAYFYLF